MIDKIKKEISDLKGKNIRFRYNGSRNQIEVFEGVIVNCYKSLFVIKVDKINKSFTYSDVLIGVLDVNI